MNIGQNILFYRKKLQLSQEQLAEQIDVTRQTISNWELEESFPDVKQMVKLTEVFGISLDTLVNYEVKESYDSNKEITIVSKIENVIAKCNKIQASQTFKGGKNSPKYALFAGNNNNDIFSTNIFLGWYRTKKDINDEIEGIVQAMTLKENIYELKYNVEVDKKLLGMYLKIKE